MICGSLDLIRSVRMSSGGQSDVRGFGSPRTPPSKLRMSATSLNPPGMCCAVSWARCSVTALALFFYMVSNRYFFVRNHTSIFCFHDKGFLDARKEMLVGHNFHGSLVGKVLVIRKKAFLSNCLALSMPF